MIDSNLSTTQTGIKPHQHTQISPTLFDGIYHSNSVNKSPEEVYAFCKNEANFKRVLSDLPEKIENFLDLEFFGGTNLDKGMFRVEWKNKKTADIQGTLALILSPGPAGRGTNIIANAIFGDYTMENENPSDFINVFLKRFKALAETGQLATITGQPNGKDEDEMKKSSHQH